MQESLVLKIEKFMQKLLTLGGYCKALLDISNHAHIWLESDKELGTPSCKLGGFPKLLLTNIKSRRIMWLIMADPATDYFIVEIK